MRLHWNHRRGADGEPTAELIELRLDYANGSFGAADALVLVSVMRLQPTDGSARLVAIEGSRSTIAPSGPVGVSPWIVTTRSEFNVRHRNDGPTAAYVLHADGTTTEVDVADGVSRTIGDAPPARRDPGPATDAPALVPAPVAIERRHDTRTATGAHLIDPAGIHDVWSTVGQLAERLTGANPLDDPAGSPTTIEVDATLAPAAYRLTIGPERVSVRAADRGAVRQALVTLVQWLGTAHHTGVVDDRPAWPRRVVHLDLARRWYPPDVVLRLIDLAAWRKFNVVHLHLTDDEAWRMPIADLPDLGRIGGTRGHGLPIGPQCSSGAAPYGRCYTAGEIGSFVTRADALGIELMPEVDVPGHSHAALVSLPSLRDPGDRSTAVSVQGYRNNVLVPGLAATDALLDTVFGTLADLFPSSPYLHIGGDEVPAAAWRGSPAALEFADARGCTLDGLPAAMTRRIVDRVVAATGRRVAAWEEAALCGALRPDDGYVVAWTSATTVDRLIDAGYDTVASPGSAYYLDMAADQRWSAPGASWAGHADLATVAAFEPPADDRLLGLQASLWSEHVSGPDVLDELMFPRLDAIAERAWRGTVDLATIGSRSARQPRFSK